MCVKCVTASATWDCAEWRKDTHTLWMSSATLNLNSLKKYVSQNSLVDQWLIYKYRYKYITEKLCSKWKKYSLMIYELKKYLHNPYSVFLAFLCFFPLFVEYSILRSQIAIYVLLITMLCSHNSNKWLLTLSYCSYRNWPWNLKNGEILGVLQKLTSFTCRLLEGWQSSVTL